MVTKLIESGDYHTEGKGHVYLFDMLAYADKTLCHLSLQERQQYLDKVVGGSVHRVKSEPLMENLESRLTQMQKEARDAGVEGLMIKSLDAPYEVSGKKVNTWLKLKNIALTTDMRDTLDLVPIGAFYGRGNRTGMYGSFLMASYNSASQKFETICKLGTGFTQKQLAEIELEPLASTP